MEFIVPATGDVFEIPEEWWAESGMVGFAPRGTAYRHLGCDDAPIQPVSLNFIEPPLRDNGVEGLRRERTIRILRGFVANDAIDAVPIDVPPGERRFRYRVRDGFHRYYCSIAAGFTRLPSMILPYFDIRDPNC
jgi:hypothetical protein